MDSDKSMVDVANQHFSEDLFASQENIENLNRVEDSDRLITPYQAENNDEIELDTAPEADENAGEPQPHSESSDPLLKDNTDKQTLVPEKLVHLPLARIKGIIKLDQDVNLISSDAVFAVTKATELFIESLAKECYVHTSQAKKKTVQRKDLDAAIATVDQLIFLDGAIV